LIRESKYYKAISTKDNIKREIQMNNKAQIWIETVIYTLIAFVLIAAVLAFVKPKIDELQDKAIIEQSISMLKDVDSTVRDVVQGGSGNKRKLEIGINKGNFQIDGESNLLLFEIESNFIYSEIGKEIYDGNIIIKTKELGDKGIVTLKRVYEDYNITFNNKEAIKTIGKAATSYNLFVSNKGRNENDTWQVDFELN